MNYFNMTKSSSKFYKSASHLNKERPLPPLWLVEIQIHQCRTHTTLSSFTSTHKFGCPSYAWHGLSVFPAPLSFQHPCLDFRSSQLLHGSPTCQHQVCCNTHELRHTHKLKKIKKVRDDTDDTDTYIEDIDTDLEDTDTAAMRHMCSDPKLQSSH